jgi:hypothetical protein
MNQNTTSSVVPTKYWHQLEDGRIQCDLCPRLCQLKDGQRGLCFVRARQQNAIVLSTLWALQRILHRPDRKEAAQPFSARHGGAVLRHGRMQSRVQVLSELGHE